MDIPQAWPAAAEAICETVSDLGVNFHSGLVEKGVTEGSPFQHPVPHPEYARGLDGKEDATWKGATTTHEPVETGEGTGDMSWDGHPTQLTPVPEVAAPLSRASSATLDGIDEGSATPVEFKVHRSKHIEVVLPKSTLIFPKSQHDGYTPPLPISKERDAVPSLIEAAEALGNTSGEFEFELDSFSFYVHSAYYKNEMQPLHSWATKTGHDQFYFDGILSVGDVKHYVQRVPVLELPVGNYGEEHDTVKRQIWVRSVLNKRREIYYRLKRPSLEYERFYTPFLWVADLAKHVVDFTAAMLDQRRKIDIHAFREDFFRWLRHTHGESAGFMRWQQQHPSPDYRTAVAASIHFIWKEMNGILTWNKAQSLPLFREIMHISRYQQAPAPSPPLPMVVQGAEQVPPTIVTAYIKECFGHMVIGKMFKVVGDQILDHIELTKTGLLNGAAAASTTSSSASQRQRIASSKRSRNTEACFLPLVTIHQIKVGDTISTPRDGDHTGSKWRDMVPIGAVADDRWFGLVQKVHIGKDGSRSFDVTWFYRPVETPCCMMKYPWSNELFLSDHCTCEEGRHARVKEHEVLAVHDINWFGGPNGRGEFFVRQMYMIEGRRWVTLQDTHLRCSHGRESLGFRAGDTVLATEAKDQEFAEVYEVDKVFRQAENMFVRLRRLLRRSQVDPGAGAAPNELVYTDELVVVKPQRVLGKCSVRFFKAGQEIPVPYKRNGTGNLFFITHRLEVQDDGAERCVPFRDFPGSLRQGLDPTEPIRKLRGMDLFCGSGNFGRGLEEGGAVEMHWANDIWDRAIHTYMANAPDPKSTHPFLGSVDDLLRLALEGKYSENVPRPGEVEFISAGSPCPGFSLLTTDKTTLTQIKNKSLVASFASFVDFYRPKYGVLENVEGIVQATHNRSEDVLSQLFCAIVGMGYQAQLILGDAWSHGAAQNRSRVFLYFAAPGLRLPEAPLLSHSHHEGSKERNLGKLCNGEPFVRRSFQCAPFKYVSAAEATADLPLIRDGKAEPGALAFPDHRAGVSMTQGLRSQIAAIPTHPHGMSFAKAWRGGKGTMTASERELFPPRGQRVDHPESRGWRRVEPNEVFQTITTRCQPTEARAGTGLHWMDNRPMSLLEARRAQGFPDEEVLLGSMADRWKLVGNSVARQMALALGLKFREAWVGGMREGSESVSASASASVSGRIGRTTTPSLSVKGRADLRRSASVAVSDRVQPAVMVNKYSFTKEVVDLTTEVDTKHIVHQQSVHREVVDLTMDSQTATPESAMPATVTNGSKRKRLMSYSTGTEVEIRSSKTVRLDSQDLDSEIEFTNGVEHGPGMEQEEESLPARTGPTIVRLWTPEDESSDPMADGLGPGDELN